MGTLLTLLMETLLKKEEPKEHEIDHNVVICCGSLNVTEHESKSDLEESDVDQDTLRR